MVNVDTRVQAKCQQRSESLAHVQWRRAPDMGDGIRMWVPGSANAATRLAPTSRASASRPTVSPFGSASAALGVEASEQPAPPVPGYRASVRTSAAAPLVRALLAGGVLCCVSCWLQLASWGLRGSPSAVVGRGDPPGVFCWQSTPLAVDAPCTGWHTAPFSCSDPDCPAPGAAEVLPPRESSGTDVAPDTVAPMDGSAAVLMLIA